jgi:hypothetical protein
LLLAGLWLVVAGCAGAPFEQRAASAAGSSFLETRDTPLSRTENTGFVYVKNHNDTLSVFGIDRNGVLESEPPPSVPYPVTFGSQPYSITASTRFVFLTGNAASFVMWYDVIGDKIGFFQGSRVAGAGLPVVADGANRLYVLSSAGRGSVYGFQLIDRYGLMPPLPGSPYAISCPGGCSSSPAYAVADGKNLCVVDRRGFVSVFSSDSEGALTEGTPVQTGSGPVSAAITPNHKFLYVANGASQSISAYAIDGSTLTPLSGSPFKAEGLPSQMAIRKDGSYLYLADTQGSGIRGYAIAASGALDELPNSPYSDPGGAPLALTLDRYAHLYVTNPATNTVAAYASDGRTGDLRPLSGSPFALPSGAAGPLGIAVVENPPPVEK